MKKRISIRDVAESAGASITTVSRVISNPGYPVSAGLRKKILDAIEKLNYSPTSAAQTLKKGYSNVIGLIVRDIADPYFGELAKGVTEKAMELGFLCFVCNTGRNPRNEIEYLELLWSHKTRGIIMAGGGIDTPEYREKIVKQLQRGKNQGMRFIGLGPQNLEIPTVSIDYFAAATLILEYLFTRGNARIAMISGADRILTSQEHFKAYRSFLSNHGLPFNPGDAIFEGFTEHGGYEGCGRLIARRNDFDAIFCGSDTIAIGVLHRLAEKGVRVPQDISVMGIGDIPQARFTVPPLTTIRVPRYEIGARAVELIANDDGSALEENTLFFPVIVERQSVIDRGVRDFVLKNA